MVSGVTLFLLASRSSPRNRRLNSTMGGGVLLEGGSTGLVS
jgi:hypothetical protein